MNLADGVSSSCVKAMEQQGRLRHTPHPVNHMFHTVCTCTPCTTLMRVQVDARTYVLTLFFCFRETTIACLVTSTQIIGFGLPIVKLAFWFHHSLTRWETARTCVFRAWCWSLLCYYFWWLFLCCPNLSLQSAWVRRAVLQRNSFSYHPNEAEELKGYNAVK